LSRRHTTYCAWPWPCHWPISISNRDDKKLLRPSLESRAASQERPRQRPERGPSEKLEILPPPPAPPGPGYGGGGSAAGGGIPIPLPACSRVTPTYTQRQTNPKNRKPLGTKSRGLRHKAGQITACVSGACLGLGGNAQSMIACAYCSKEGAGHCDLHGRGLRGGWRPPPWRLLGRCNLRGCLPCLGTETR
jgi:hypothetical protein